jgi:hypothetical protein
LPKKLLFALRVEKTALNQKTNNTQKYAARAGKTHTLIAQSNIKIKNVYEYGAIYK